MPKRKSLTKIQKHWLEKRLSRADFTEKLRLHYYLGVILEDENEIQECFRTIQSEVLDATIKKLTYNENARIVKDKHTVKLPLRVNWGGGWSDTPPYCNENGGTVLNVAILLNGEKPVEVTIEKIGAHACGYNAQSIGICYEGGISERGRLADTRTVWQKHSLRVLVRALLVDYPGCKVCGHRDLSPDLNGNGEIEPEEWVKQCPCFDVSKEKYSK